MKRRFGLAGVLRVRRLQEDLARDEVAQSQAAARRAEDDAATRARRLAESALPDRATVLAFRAAATARMGLAGEATAARARVDDAHREVDEHLAVWHERAMRVDALESLEERHRAAVRAADLTAEQSAADDLAATAWRRAHDREDR